MKDANIQSLTGGLRLRVRVQHPGIHERTDRAGTYWFFRYWDDVPQPGSKVKPVRRFHIIGPSKGENRLSKKQAEVERDKFLAKINKPTVQEKIGDGLVLFSKMVEKYKATHVEAQVAGRFLLAKPTRLKYAVHLEQRILPQWGNRRLCEINPDEVQQWLFDSCESWHMMNDLRGIMSGIYTKAEEWGYWPEGRRNPMSRVKIGEKWSVRPERILTEEETVKVLARLRDPNLLIVETAIATGARISEMLGLKWRHIDLKAAVIQIVQRNWRGDIDDPKSKTSKRPLTLGYLGDRYRAKAAADNAKADKWVFVRTDSSGLPLWDSGVRQALKRAAAAEGCDFPGLGPHSFRRANITWRQEVGGSSIEASKIAGHSTVRMTEEYTKIQLARQEELTWLIQERLASVGEKQTAVVQ
ncbi:MAG TPA: tyrosine-type recombinase/integrase [Bryobacteraceae bacterium]|nr:tyrosine-type recombinase/integrase [Bryobacteraceae bacterium]